MPAPTYQWRKHGQDIPGATTNSLVLAQLTASDAADYDVVVTNRVGSITSPAATLTVHTAPVISSHPQSQTVTLGSPVTLTVVASGTPVPTYQWRKNGSVITGATAASLDLGPVALDDEGNYDVLVSNSVDTVTSSVATIVVQAAPAITVQPQSQVILNGEAVTLSVEATGAPLPSYQWRKNGGNLSGETSSSLVLSSTSTAAAGSYTVVVFNDVGTVVSQVATLSVVDLTATHASASYTPGESVTVTNTVSVVGPASKLVWSVVPPGPVGGQSWSFSSQTGSFGDATPELGDSDLLEWTWNTIPASPFTFSYTLTPPVAAAGNYHLTAMIELTSAAGPLQKLGFPDPLVLSELSSASFHSADTDQDLKINLSELLRVIELYNTRSGTTRTGRYQAQAGTVDGFAPDTSTTSGTPSSRHSADTDGDGKLSLSELLRVIELYNTRSGTTRTGQYHPDTTTADGFAPGAG